MLATEACERAGIGRVTWHKLRHTTATELMRQGVPLAVVSEVLGHTSVEMTKRYTHVAPHVAWSFMQLLSNSVKSGPSPEALVTRWSPGPIQGPIAPADGQADLG